MRNSVPQTEWSLETRHSISKAGLVLGSYLDILAIHKGVMWDPSPANKRGLRFGEPGSQIPVGDRGPQKLKSVLP